MFVEWNKILLGTDTSIRVQLLLSAEAKPLGFFVQESMS
jgi:hypothetical protein